MFLTYGIIRPLNRHCLCVYYSNFDIRTCSITFYLFILFLFFFFWHTNLSNTKQIYLFDPNRYNHSDLSGPGSNGNGRVWPLDRTPEPHHQMQFSVILKLDLSIYIYIYIYMREREWEWKNLDVESVALGNCMFLTYGIIRPLNQHCLCVYYSNFDIHALSLIPSTLYKYSQYKRQTDE